jgi:phosphopantothenoylcysteine decarboxylase/phosphopantothenate--cysteine ligase
MLNGRKILIGVSGGIAAYKTATIVRLLVKEGCEVKVVMTDRAKDFITPLTLATLSRIRYQTVFFHRKTEYGTVILNLECGPTCF